MDAKVRKALDEFGDRADTVQRVMGFTDEQMARVLQIMAQKLMERSAKRGTER